MTPERKTAQQPKPIAATAAQLATWLIGHDDPEVVARLVVHSDGKVYDGDDLYFCKVCGCNSLDESITLAICEPCREAENGPSDDEIEDTLIEADIERQEMLEALNAVTRLLARHGIGAPRVDAVIAKARGRG